MIYGLIVGETKYKVIDMIKLPEEVQNELCDDCPGNDTARITNPEYNPKLKEWLKANGHSDTDCYIGWWSW